MSRGPSGVASVELETWSAWQAPTKNASMVAWSFQTERGTLPLDASWPKAVGAAHRSGKALGEI